MAQEQNYQVNYSINVDASQGTKQVIAFGEAVGKLVQAKASLTPAVTNIKNMMDEIDRVFRTKNGKKRNFDYRLTIDTKKSEEKLERIKGLLTDISTLSKGISLTINAGQALDSKKIKANAKSLYEKKAAEMRKAEIEKNAASSVGTMADAQKRITKAIGKINSALVSMERDRELQIKTGTAENRLQQILSLWKNALFPHPAPARYGICPIADVFRPSDNGRLFHAVRPWWFASHRIPRSAVRRQNNTAA